MSAHRVGTRAGRPLRVALVVVAALVGVQMSVAAGPARADTPTVVTIVSPASGATVAGLIDVVLHVVPGTQPGYTVDVGVGDAGITTVSASAPIPADCGTGCDVHVSLDLGAPNQMASVNAPIADGPMYLQAWVFTSQVTSEPLVLDNQRPTVVCPSDPSALDWCTAPHVIGAATVLPLSVSVTPGGSPVSRVVWVPWIGTDQDLTPDPDGTWSIPLDASSWISGLDLRGALVAYDTRGIASRMLNIRVLVDRTITLTTGLNTSQPVSDDVCIPFTVTHDTSTGALPDVYTESYVATVDGVRSGSGGWWTATMPTGPETLTACPWAGGDALPPGQHIVTITVTDTAGGTGTWSAALDVVSTMPGWIAADPGPYVRLGQPVTVTASFASTDTDLWWWDLTDNGVGVTSFGSAGQCTANCPTSASPTVTWTPTSYGSHTLSWFVIPHSGGYHRFSTVVHVLPDATAIPDLPRPVVPGHLQQFDVRVRLADGTTGVGTDVALQYRPSDAATWATVASGTTGPTGVAVLTVAARATGLWRALSTDRLGSWWGMAGPAIDVTALPIVALSLRSPRAGIVTATTVARYAPTGTRVILQMYRSNHWVTLTFGRLSRTGTWVKTVLSTHRHRLVLRAFLVATSLSAPASSSARAVTP